MKMSSFSLLAFFLVLICLLPLLSSARPCSTTPLLISVVTTTTSGDSHLLTVYRITPLRRPHHLPLHSHPFNPSSFHDRVTDILSVVASLLFGFVCGAVIASIMYLLWHVFIREEEEEAENEKINPKEMGYVKIQVVVATKEEGK